MDIPNGAARKVFATGIKVCFLEALKEILLTVFYDPFSPWSHKSAMRERIEQLTQNINLTLVGKAEAT